jgi:ornithine cyclodeaminase/alanine dehydrogenase-like protein (mu-crystallin family)
MLFLSGNDIRACLSYNEVMNSVEEALGIYEKGDFTMPDRLSVSCGGNSILLLMPCVAEGSFSTKLVTVFPENKSKGKPRLTVLWY